MQAGQGGRGKKSCRFLHAVNLAQMGRMQGRAGKARNLQMIEHACRAKSGPGQGIIIIRKQDVLRI